MTLLPDPDWMVSELTKDDSGALSRPLVGMMETADWATRDGNRLWCHGRRTFEIDAHVFDRFVMLETGDEVQDYARTFGTLAVPTGPRLPGDITMPAPFQAVKITRSRQREGWYESIDEWLLLVHHFRAILDIAAAARTTDPVPPETVTALGAYGNHRLRGRLTGSGPAFHTLDRLRAPAFVADWGDRDSVSLNLAVSDLVNRWLVLAPAVPQTWVDDTGRIRVYVRANSLLSALVLQLAYATARTDAPATCSSCGVIYTPRRAPQRGRANYCESCGERAAARERKRRQRERQQKASD